MACAEDEDFIQALDKMMLENLQVRVAMETTAPVVTLIRILIYRNTRTFPPIAVVTSR